MSNKVNLNLKDKKDNHVGSVRYRECETSGTGVILMLVLTLLCLLPLLLIGYEIYDL